MAVNGFAEPVFDVLIEIAKSFSGEISQTKRQQ
jgi:hypothetical protein